jgi:hypothetical protein
LHINEYYLGTIRIPPERIAALNPILIIYNKDTNTPVLRYTYDMRYGELGLQIVLDYINENNLGTYSHCEFVTSAFTRSANEVIVIYFNNVNPKLLLGLI